MKKAWIAYVLMMTASTSATATRIGNSRQNDRFLRGRRRVDPADPANPQDPADPACFEGAASSSADAPATLALAAPSLAVLLVLPGPAGALPFPPPADPDAPDPSSGASRLALIRPR